MKNLTQKLINVMNSVDRVSKTGHNNHQNYNYITEADVLEAIRGELAKQKVFVFTSVDNVVHNEQITTVLLLHTFVDSESGEQFQVKSAGQGWDKLDKGIYKGITGAVKYFITKNFMLPGGDDPENDESHSSSVTSKQAPSLSKSFSTMSKSTFSSAVSSIKEDPKVTSETPITNGSGSTETPKFSKRLLNK